MSSPPPIPSERKSARVLILLTGVVLIVVIIGVVFGFRVLGQRRFAADVCLKFDQQALGTAVALIELHEIRFGKYPDSLGDLKYKGEWDQLYLDRVRYCPSEDGQSYYVEVSDFWINKPSLVMPEEFWQGTGYDRNQRREIQ